MKYNRLGDSELRVSELCLGTMTFGEQNTAQDAARQLDYALSQGVNFIDTAEMYPVPPRAETCHRTEQYVGRWLKNQARENLVIATKVAGPARGFDWIRGGTKVTRQHIELAIDASLKRLQTDYVDLYQIHWPDRNTPYFGQTAYDPVAERETTPITEQLAVLGELVKSGKVRYVGVSNESAWGLSQFLKASETAGLPRIITIQNAYNLINRIFEYGLAEFCHRERIGLLAYSPLGFGVLSGKYLSAGGSGRNTLFSGFGHRYGKPNAKEAVIAYSTLAAKVGMSPATLALAFVRSRWFVSSAIIGATTMEQLKENMDSCNVGLDAETIKEIEAIHLRYPNPAP